MYFCDSQSAPHNPRAINESPKSEAVTEQIQVYSTQEINPYNSHIILPLQTHSNSRKSPFRNRKRGSLGSLSLKFEADFERYGPLSSKSLRFCALYFEEYLCEVIGQSLRQR
jgi:hypothetical protein